MITGKCNVSEYILKEAHGKVESPGMLYRHYAPNTKCLLCDEDKINEISSKYKNPIIIGNKKVNNYKFYNYGNDLVSIAHNIFKILREADQEHGDVIIIQSVETKGLGLAIMNRLIRTCEYNYIKRENENN